MEIKIEKVMDRKKVAESIHQILDAGIAMLKKDKLDQSDYGKLKVLRTLGVHVSSAIAMVAQETSQLRAAIVFERMKQLGYNIPDQIS